MSGPVTGTHYPEFQSWCGHPAGSGTAGIIRRGYILNLWPPMDKSGLQWFLQAVRTVQGPFSSAAILSWVVESREDTPATLTAVGVVSSVGPFQWGIMSAVFNLYAY